jgi:hypothetical protein
MLGSTSSNPPPPLRRHHPGSLLTTDLKPKQCPSPLMRDVGPSPCRSTQDNTKGGRTGMQDQGSREGDTGASRNETRSCLVAHCSDISHTAADPLGTPSILDTPTPTRHVPSIGIAHDTEASRTRCPPVEQQARCEPNDDVSNDTEANQDQRPRFERRDRAAHNEVGSPVLLFENPRRRRVVNAEVRKPTPIWATQCQRMRHADDEGMRPAR